jgi:hypothetical protein
MDRAAQARTIAWAAEEEGALVQLEDGGEARYEADRLAPRDWGGS